MGVGSTGGWRAAGVGEDGPMDGGSEAEAEGARRCLSPSSWVRAQLLLPKVTTRARGGVRCEDGAVPAPGTAPPPHVLACTPHTAGHTCLSLSRNRVMHL